MQPTMLTAVHSEFTPPTSVESPKRASLIIKSERKIFEAVLRDQRDRFLQQLAFQISVMILIGHFLTSLFVVMGLL